MADLPVVVRENNAIRVRGLITAAKSPGRLVPWVGAGFSVPMGFPTMHGLLERLLKHVREEEFGSVTQLPDDARGRLLGSLESDLQHGKDYAEIASVLRAQIFGNQDARFYTALRQILTQVERQIHRVKFGHHFLRAIQPKRIVTTNYDRLLETYVLPHAAAITARDKELNYYRVQAPDQPVVFKLHGDIGRPISIPFTDAEFQLLYDTRVDSQESVANEVTTLLNELASRSTFLFLGTSLTKSEKYFDLFRNVLLRAKHNRSVDGSHYAVLNCQSQSELERREIELGELNIVPIWYQYEEEPGRETPGEHGPVVDLLARIAANVGSKLDIDNPPAGRRVSAVYAPSERTRYLNAQLSLEKRAKVITYVTPKLTNAIAPPTFLRSRAVPNWLLKNPAAGLDAPAIEDLIQAMTHRAQTLEHNATSRETVIRVLCSAAKVVAELTEAKATSTAALFDVIGRLLYLFELAAVSQFVEVRIAHSFSTVEGDPYAIDSYALIVSPHAEGSADVSMCFASQATSSEFEASLIEVNTELARDRAARAEELWWSALSETDSLRKLWLIIKTHHTGLMP